jgi:hypothetical protein
MEEWVVSQLLGSLKHTSAIWGPRIKIVFWSLFLITLPTWGRCCDHNFRRFSTIFG